MSRLPREGHPLYHVIHLDRAARQVGALVSAAGVMGAFAQLRNRFVTPRGVMLVFCLLIVGATFFVIGQWLRNRPSLAPAYGLLTLSGLCVGTCVAQLGLAWLASIPYVDRMTCPSIFGLALTSPLLWHAVNAVRDLRRGPTSEERGFAVLTPPTPPRAEPSGLDERGCEL